MSTHNKFHQFPASFTNQFTQSYVKINIKLKKIRNQTGNYHIKALSKQINPGKSHNSFHRSRAQCRWPSRCGVPWTVCTGLSGSCSSRCGWWSRGLPSIASGDMGHTAGSWLTNGETSRPHLESQRISENQGRGELNWVIYLSVNGSNYIQIITTIRNTGRDIYTSLLRINWCSTI